MIFKNAARRIAAEQIDMGVELRGTHCDTSAMPRSRISSRNGSASSKPTGLPMSRTTRWNRSRPSDVDCGGENLPEPIQL